MYIPVYVCVRVLNVYVDARGMASCQSFLLFFELLLNMELEDLAG